MDNGSWGRTFAVAKKIAARGKCLGVVKFRSNHGRTRAMAAGTDVAHGDIVVGWRFYRQDKLVSRKVPSRMANWPLGKVTEVLIKDNGCPLKAYGADVIKHA